MYVEQRAEPPAIPALFTFLARLIGRVDGILAHNAETTQSALVLLLHRLRCTLLQVREVKGVIEQQNAEFPAAQLKLIHSGQILKDDSTLAEYKIKEEEFLVCMVTKVSALENLACRRLETCVSRQRCLVYGWYLLAQEARRLRTRPHMDVGTPL